jgi:hypothetical protein
MTGGAPLGNLLFYAVESAIGAGYWWGISWIGYAALVENLIYLATAFDNVIFGSVNIALRLDPGAPGPALAAQNFHHSIPGFLFSVFFVVFFIRRALVR